jgi:hypothetical protein
MSEERTYATLYYARNAAEAFTNRGKVNVRIIKRGRKFVVRFDEPNPNVSER